MSILNSIFSNRRAITLKLRFSELENGWSVTKGHDILYKGDKQQCKNYILHNNDSINYIFIEIIYIISYQLRYRMAFI